MIGAGVITCNREKFFRNCISSIPKVDFLMVVNDGMQYQKDSYPLTPHLIIQHQKNQGVAKSKNEIIKILMERSCEHIFLIEDDVTIQSADVFNHYIETACKTGIYHLNFAFHGDGNRDNNGIPVSRKILFENGKEVLSLNKNILGAFSYFHRSIIEKFGLIDEKYMNGLEHVDHTYQIIKGGYHPPFWWFADAPKSYDYILDQDDDHSKSIIRKKRLLWKYRQYKNIRHFKKKNLTIPFEIPDTREDAVLAIVEEIKNNYGGSCL
jgi:GT2 family glycosyltransferase